MLINVDLMLCTDDFEVQNTYWMVTNATKITKEIKTIPKRKYKIKIHLYETEFYYTTHMTSWINFQFS